MANKVFCGECRHYWEDDFGNRACTAIGTADSDWYGEYTISANPEKLNKHNDCQHWQHKRRFIEWFLVNLEKIVR